MKINRISTYILVCLLTIRIRNLLVPVRADIEGSEFSVTVPTEDETSSGLASPDTELQVFKDDTDGNKVQIKSTDFFEDQYLGHLTYVFKRGVKCTLVKFENKDVWKRGDQGVEHPKSVTYDSVLKEVAVRDADNSVHFEKATTGEWQHVITIPRKKKFTGTKTAYTPPKPNDGASTTPPKPAEAPDSSIASPDADNVAGESADAGSSEGGEALDAGSGMSTGGDASSGGWTSGEGADGTVASPAANEGSGNDASSGEGTGTGQDGTEKSGLDGSASGSPEAGRSSTTPPASSGGYGTSGTPSQGSTTTPTGSPAGGTESSTKTGVELSLKEKKATPQFGYKKSGKVVTYTAKGSNAFKSVKTTKGGSCGSGGTEVPIWDAKDASEYGSIVVLDGKGKKEKSVTIKLPNDTKKVFKRDGKDKPWKEVGQQTNQQTNRSTV